VGFSVHADGDPRLIQRLNATVQQGTLLLGWQGGGESIHNERLQITVTLPRLAGAGISGAGTMTVDRVEAPHFAANVARAGSMRIASLRSDEPMLAMGGTGQIMVTGTTGRLDARVSGVGSIDAAGLAARSGNISMSGTGQVRTRIDGPADVTLSGLGQVEV